MGLTLQQVKTGLLQRLLLGILGLMIVSLVFSPAITKAAGQEGAVDLTFNPALGTANNSVLAVALQQDGKILVGGDFTTYNSIARNRIARLNSDGTLDTTFNPGNGVNNSIRMITVQSDGKILIGGFFTTYNGASRKYLARLNSDGTLDTTFNNNINDGPNGFIYAIVQQSDGKILIGGAFTSYSGASRNRIVRLNLDGTLDSSFTPGSGADETISILILQSNGKILVGGQFFSYNNVSREGIVRLNTDGTLDTTFNPGGTGATGAVHGIAVQSNGQIIIGGWFLYYNGVSRKYLARLNSDGTLDTTFNPTTTDSGINVTLLQPDGRIIIGGYFTTYNNTSRTRVARLNSDGTLDSSFNPGTGANGDIFSMVLQNDGNILIGGRFTLYNGKAPAFVTRLDYSGSSEGVFNIPGVGTNIFGTGNSGRTIAIQKDGKILIGGDFSAYNNIARWQLARLNTDGTLDTSFNPGKGSNGAILGILVQPDGKVIISGLFTMYNDIPRANIARLNPDGTLDSSFVPASNAFLTIYSAKLQSDGKIVIGGSRNTSNSPSLTLARLNTDGTLDTTFNQGNSGTTAGSYVSVIAIQPDDKILISGDFSSYNGISRGNVARLNSDGTLDTGFQVGSGTEGSIPNAITLQPDGKILLGGTFPKYNGTVIHGLARLNTDGTLDTSLSSGLVPGNSIKTIALQNNGKILIGGHLVSYNGVTLKNIARLNTDGTLDNSFNATTDANPNYSADVEALAVQSNEKVLVAGYFTKVNNSNISGIARLESNLPSTVTLTSVPNPATIGESITFTATVSPITATGSVQFVFSNTNTVTATLNNGLATYITNTLPVGLTPLIAKYSGDASLQPNNSPVYTQTVNKIATAITVTSSPNPNIYGQTVTFSATVSPAAASGLVTFTIGAASVARPLDNGIATYITDTLPGGTYPVSAFYEGNAVYSSSLSSGQYTHTVIIPCDPLVVTKSADDGQATSCGTLSYALLTASSGTTITFALTQTNTITFSGSLTPTVAAGVTIDGGANGVILEGNGVSGPGLRLSGQNVLKRLTVRHFGAQEILLLVGSRNNWLERVKLEN